MTDESNQKMTEIDQKMTENEPKKEPKKRAPVEYNGMELVLTLIILFEDINNYDELLEKIREMIINPTKYATIIIFNQIEIDFKNYVNDIGKKKTIVNDYITCFRNLNLKDILQVDNIKCIYISGKKNKHTKINELNKNYDKKAAKADIYIEYKTEDLQILGISVKQSKGATKSNYSVHKMLGNDLDKELTKVKKTYLNANGFLSFDKAQRCDINALFYLQNKENLYWLRIKTEIINNNEKILTQLINSLYCSNIKYDIYEFDGSSFAKLNKVIDMSTVVFEEYLPYYLKKSGVERKAAKLFYRLTVGEKIYRVEVRWKGDIYNAAPQFQIHNETDDDDDDEYKI